GAAPGAAGDRQRGRSRQRVRLPLRPGQGRAARHAMNDATDALRDPGLYLNRELGQLAFNARVLAQARDPSVPVLERLRFLCISCTNLDEFFEIRAATVRHAQDYGMPAAPDGIAPAALLRRIHAEAAGLVKAQYDCWNREL